VSPIIIKTNNTMYVAIKY